MTWLGSGNLAVKRAAFERVGYRVDLRFYPLARARSLAEQAAKEPWELSPVADKKAQMEKLVARHPERLNDREWNQAVRLSGAGFETFDFRTTKVYFPMSEEDQGLSAAQIRKQLDGSLRRLRVDHVDLYQCHRFDPEVPLEETMAALTRAV